MTDERGHFVLVYWEYNLIHDEFEDESREVEAEYPSPQAAWDAARRIVASGTGYVEAIRACRTIPLEPGAHGDRILRDEYGVDTGDDPDLVLRGPV